jgi:excinuclease UvrABC helicase subunit UvrB
MYLKINKFFEKVNQTIYVSATPGRFEKGQSSKVSTSQVDHRQKAIKNKKPEYNLEEVFSLEVLEKFFS